MTSWQIWIVVSIILFILEVFTPGFVLASLGLGALSGATFAFLGFGITVQVIGFSLASLVVFFAIRPIYQAYILKYDDQTPMGVAAMLGKKVVVMEPIHGEIEAGRIKLGGETWRAFAEGDTSFKAGDSVSIIKVDGASVWVASDEKE
jgi:membrane protein implicated in regulation of membrane protease activity